MVVGVQFSSHVQSFWEKGVPLSLLPSNQENLVAEQYSPPLVLVLASSSDAVGWVVEVERGEAEMLFSPRYLQPLPSPHPHSSPPSPLPLSFSFPDAVEL